LACLPVSYLRASLLVFLIVSPLVFLIVSLIVFQIVIPACLSHTHNIPILRLIKCFAPLKSQPDRAVVLHIPGAST
jgi:hypothetical protein